MLPCVMVRKESLVSFSSKKKKTRGPSKSPTPFCVAQRGVLKFTNFSAKMKFYARPFSLLIRDLAVIDSIKKKEKKSCDTAPLNSTVKA